MVKPKTKGRSTSSKSVLFLSDMHVGSIYAVRSPEAQIDDGSIIKMNPFNEQMYDNWGWCIDQLNNKTPDILVLNGEPIDGGNSKSNASGTWTSSVDKQLDDAERLIRMYNWREFIATRGSRYHVAVQNAFHEEVMARRLKARPYSGIFGKAQENLKQNKSEKKGTDETGQYTDFYVQFVFGGKNFNVCHHVGYNKSELYRTTAMGREMATMKLAKGRWYDDRIDIFARSHVHYYVQLRFIHQIGFTTPCWKFPDEFQQRRGQGGTAVDIGTIEVIIEPNEHVDIYEHIIPNDRYPKPKVINFDEILG